MRIKKDAKINRCLLFFRKISPRVFMRAIIHIGACDKNYLNTTLRVAPLGTVLGNVHGGCYRMTMRLALRTYPLADVVGLAVGLGRRLEIVQFRQIAEHVEGIEIDEHVVRRVDEIHRVDDVVVSRRWRRRRVVYHVR